MDTPRENLLADRPADSRLCLHCVACSMRRVGRNVGHPRAALRAAPYHRWTAQAARTMHVGRSRGFGPVDSFLNRNHFLFVLNSLRFQTLKIHI
jgi:hypothetical protein